MRSWPTSLLLGIGLLVLGTGPLLLFVVADSLGMIRDPDPNPIGLGLLFFFSFWPALIMIVVGVLQLVSRRLRA